MQISRLLNPPSPGPTGSRQDAPSLPGRSTATRLQPGRADGANPGPRRSAGSPGPVRPRQPPPPHLQPNFVPRGIVLDFIHYPPDLRVTRVMTTHVNPAPLRQDPAQAAAGLDFRTNTTCSAQVPGVSMQVPPNLPLADCGQYAAQTAGVYRVAPMHVYAGGHLPANHSRTPHHQVMAPTRFARGDGHLAADFVNLPIPASANAVAFAVTPEDGARRAAFHYARIEQEPTGRYHLTQTDANWNDPVAHPLEVSRAWDVLTNLPDDDQVRAFIEQNPNFCRPTAQLSTTPAQRLENIAQFVEYCQRHYDTGGNGRYYYCTFQPPG